MPECKQEKIEGADVFVSVLSVEILNSLWGSPIFHSELFAPFRLLDAP
jgi:hypothetical protein